VRGCVGEVYCNDDLGVRGASGRAGRAGIGIAESLCVYMCLYSSPHGYVSLFLGGCNDDRGRGLVGAGA